MVSCFWTYLHITDYVFIAMVSFLENLLYATFLYSLKDIQTSEHIFQNFDYEYLPSIPTDEQGYIIQTEYSNVIRLVCLVLTVSLLIIWSMMYIVTCVFFHTLTEKLVLLIVGIAISLSITSSN